MHTAGSSNTVWLVCWRAFTQPWHSGVLPDAGRALVKAALYQFIKYLFASLTFRLSCCGHDFGCRFAGSHLDFQYGRRAGQDGRVPCSPLPSEQGFYTSTLSFQVFFEERQCQGNLCVIQAWPSLSPAGRNACHSEHQWGAVLYPCWRHPLSPSKQRLDSPH